MTDEDSTLFPASPDVQGQAQSRRAYKDVLPQLEQFDWWDDFRELIERGWDWRKAIYIAWASSPATGRQPETQHDLAVNVLGLASDRVIRTWRERHPEIVAEIVRMQAEPLLRHRRDIIEALAASAKNPDPKNHQDRKLALEMMGDYKPSSRQELTGKDGEQLQIIIDK